MIATINLADWLGSLLNAETPAQFFVLIALIGCTAAVLITLFVQVARYASHRAELSFKRELVDRGLSVDEIERIVSTKPTSKAQPGRRPSVEAQTSAARG
jgi:hypothetical protein